MAKKMWQFKTRNFTVRWLVMPTPVDTTGLTRAEADEWRRNIRTGKWKCFQSDIEVVCNHTGIVLGAATIGNTVCPQYSDFRDHFGVSAQGYGSYFKQSVQEAVSEARKRFPAHQAWLAQDIRPKQRALAVTLKSKVAVAGWSLQPL